MKIKRELLVHALYSLIIVVTTYYFANLILEGRFSDIALNTRKLFTGEFLKSGEQEMMKKEDKLAKDFSEYSPYFTEVIEDWEVSPRVCPNRTYLFFHDYRYTIKKPNKTFRIIALGDSYTEGFGVEINDTWPKQLERKLNELNSANFEVLSFGKGGFNTEDEVKVFKECGLLYEPDMAILQFFGNDIQNETWIRETALRMYEEYKNGERELPEELKELNLTDLAIQRWFRYFINNQEMKRCDEMPFEENWKVAEAPLIELTSITRDFGIDLIVFAFNTLQQQVPELEKMSKEHDFTFIDLNEYILWPGEDIRLPDMHLNEKGYDIISDKILEAFINLYEH